MCGQERALHRRAILGGSLMHPALHLLNFVLIGLDQLPALLIAGALLAVALAAVWILSE